MRPVELGEAVVQMDIKQSGDDKGKEKTSMVKERCVSRTISEIHTNPVCGMKSLPAVKQSIRRTCSLGAHRTEQNRTHKLVMPSTSDRIKVSAK